jgi:cellulose synthase/poly-beta-1,6-N-acetylglucosamine synthase-like glycosyltransferase
MIGGIILVLFAFMATGMIAILILVYRFQKSPTIKKDYSYQPTVSIVIPTMNEEGIIEKRLQNLLEMDYPRDKLEVIIIDNSTDRTPEIIQKYAQEHPFIKIFKQEKKGFNNALNQGYSTSEGEIVVKSDCTAFPRSDALKEIVANFADESVGAACGVHLFQGEDESLEREFKGIMYRIQLMESYLHSSLISHGAFGAYRKKLIPTLGEEITADDSEVVVNVVREGYRAIIDTDVKAREESPRSFKERRSQKNRRAAGVIRVLLKNLDMTFNRKYGMFGLVTMPVDLFLLVISPIMLLPLSLLWIYYLWITASMTLLGLTVIVLALGIGALALSAKARAILDTFISCFIGLFQAFTKKKTWK